MRSRLFAEGVWVKGRYIWLDALLDLSATLGLFRISVLGRDQTSYAGSSRGVEPATTSGLDDVARCNVPRCSSTKCHGTAVQYSTISPPWLELRFTG